MLNSFSNNVMWCVWSVVCQGISLETQCPSFFLRGWLNRHPLPGPCQNSRLLEEKQVFSINHIVYTSSLGIVSYSISLKQSFNVSVGNHLPANLPHASQEPSFYTGFSKDGNLRSIFLFYIEFSWFILRGST